MRAWFGKSRRGADGTRRTDRVTASASEDVFRLHPES